MDNFFNLLTELGTVALVILRARTPTNDHLILLLLLLPPHLSSKLLVPCLESMGTMLRPQKMGLVWGRQAHVAHGHGRERRREGRPMWVCINYTLLLQLNLEQQE